MTEAEARQGPASPAPAREEGAVPSGRLLRWAAGLLGGGVIVVLLWQAGALAFVWAGAVAGSRYVSSRFGLDPALTLAGFATAEAVYVGSIVLMLREAGRSHAWRDIRRFRARDLRLGTPRMLVLWWLNRASWVVFWTAVLAASWGRVPAWVSAVPVADIAIALFWGLVVTVGLRMPWWREDR